MHLRLQKKQIDRIVSRLKELLGRLQRADQAIAACENRSALFASHFGRALREMRSSALLRRTVTRRLGLRQDEMEEMSRSIAEARKMIRKVEDEARLQVVEVRAPLH